MASIIQRAGVVPMSIAGIAKEVSTIVISSWFFGDQITLLNSVGVAITVCGECIGDMFTFISPELVSGIGLFTHHKYRKSIDSKVPLDGHGNPIIDDGDEEDLFAPRGHDGYAQSEEAILLTSQRDEVSL